MTRPLAVAVTGGIAAGKSEALAAFARRGALVSSSDEIVHRLYREDEELKAELRARWGDAVFADDGEVDRAAVAGIVFADRAELAWLEEQLHPRVRRLYEAWLDELRASPDPPALAVAEIPLLYEARGEDRFDKVVVVTAPAHVRAERRGSADDRESRLLPDEEKLRRADFAYVNDGSLEELDRFVQGVVEELESC
ncbi:MAG TPA: dephospho-CoA kinase [Gaiellaceae bacterium]|nr:dephospho-CoA kinase [Gaiellaceae bacterium]